MKFDTLYKHVFIAEQEDISMLDEAIAGDITGEESVPEPEPTTDGVPVPDNYSVEPAPLAQPIGDAGSIKNYIMQLDQFADSLNDAEAGTSLQQIVTDLDRPGSLYQGISRETSSDIIKLAKQARDLAEILKGFAISSAKRQRDIAAGQG